MKERKPNRLKGYDYSQGGSYFVTICTKNRADHFGEINNGEMILNDCGKISDDMFKGLENIHKNIILDKYVVMPNHIHGIIIITDPIVGDANNFTNPTVGDASSRLSKTERKLKNGGENPASRTITQMRPVKDVISNCNIYVGDAFPKLIKKNQLLKNGVENLNAKNIPKMRPLPENDIEYDRTKMLLSKIIQKYKAEVTKRIKKISKLTKIWQRSFYEHIIRNEKSYNNIWEYIHYNPLKWEWDVENKLNKNPDKDYYTKLFVK